MNKYLKIVLQYYFIKFVEGSLEQCPHCPKLSFGRQKTKLIFSTSYQIYVEFSAVIASVLKHSTAI
jgi:hypothetical protein